MAAQRRFGLAYRGPYTSATGVGCRLGDGHTRARPLGERLLTAICPFGDDLTALLDEGFDDLSCEPERLLKIVNQP